MKIYLAARYERRAEMQTHGHDLRALGHEVVSSWIWTDKKSLNDHVLSKQATPEAVREVSAIAWNNVTEIAQCDAFIAFTEYPGVKENTGGRHVEMGIAMMMRSEHRSAGRMMVVGPLENVFYLADWIERFATWQDVLLEIGAAPLVARQ